MSDIFQWILKKGSLNYPSFQESQILRNAAEILTNYAFLTKSVRNRKFFKFVTMSKNFLQDSDNIVAKFASAYQNLTKNALLNFQPCNFEKKIWT